MTMTAARSLLLLALLVLAAPLSGQDPAAAPQADSVQEPLPPPTELVFEREVFAYPTFERRNPFRPLVGAQGNGPRFEQIRLRGIIWSAEARRSVALFGMGDAGAAQPDPTGAPTTRRLRVGESWGNMRVTEIQKDRVVVAVEEFGLSESKVIELTRRRGGGGQ
jgi:hypothetical protein